MLFLLLLLLEEGLSLSLPAEMPPFGGTAAMYAKGKGDHGIHVADQGPRFVPGSTKLILKVLAAGINPVDYKLPEI